jgi:DNA-binding SARP family transcriptional activator
VTEFRILGPVEVWVADRPLDLGTVKQRGVLAALLVDAGTAVSVETLIDRLWDDRPPAQARKVVLAHLSRIRRVLAEVARTGGGPVELLRRSGGYLIAVDRDRIDLHRMRHLVELADAQGTDAHRAALLAEALELWRGEPLTGLRGGWMARTQDSLRQLRIDLVLRWAETTLALDRPADVVQTLRPLAAEHQVVEPLVATLMRALRAAGRTAEALDCYTVIRTQLAEQLGTDPGPELRSLHQAMLRGEPVRRPPVAASTPRRTPPAQLPLDVHGFTGRHAELGQLDAILAAAGAQTTAVVVGAVWGPPGVGKTALAVHWAHRVADQFPDGQLHLNLRGFDPSGTAMNPSEAIHTFLEALGVPPQQIPADLTAQVNLYRTTLAGRRMLVLLDNARDAAQVRPLLPGSPGCMVLVTSRNQLPGLVAAEGAHPIALDLLSPAEARDLLAHRLGRARTAAQPEAVEDIIARCARLPIALAVVAARAASHPQLPLHILASQLRDAGGLEPFAGEDPVTDPRTVFSWSYRTLSAPAARLFRLLGLHPSPDFSAEAAASLAGIPPAAAGQLLAELTAAHLLTQPTLDRYAFHDLLRAFAVERVSIEESAEQRHAATHRMIMYYLLSAYAADRRVNPSRESLALDPPPPGVTLKEPGTTQDGLNWLATEEAVLLECIRQAHRDGFDTPAWMLAWVLAAYLDRFNRWHQAIAAHHTALAAARRLGNQTGIMRAYRGLGRTCFGLSRYAEAKNHFLDALDLAVAASDMAGQARAHINLSSVCERLLEHANALAHAEQASRLFTAVGDRHGQASALNAVGFCHILLGNPEQGLVCCQDALETQTAIDDLVGMAATLDSIGLAHYQLGRLHAAIGYYRRSLDLQRTLGNRDQEARTLIRLGETYDAAGDVDATRAAWQHALQILDELHHADADNVRSHLDCLDRRASDPA